MRLDYGLDQSYSLALSNIADIVAAVDEVHFAEDRPPEQTTIYPSAWIYPLSGSYRLINNGMVISSHTVLIEVAVERNYLPRDVDKTLAFGHRVALAILNNPSIDESVAGIGIDGEAPVRVSYGALDYAATAGIGWRIEIDFMQHHAVNRTVYEEREFDLDYDYGYADLYKEIIHLCQTVPDLKTAFERPPEQATDEIFGVVTPVNGVYGMEAHGTVRGLHNFSIEIHQARNQLPLDSDNVIPLGPRLAQKLLENQTLNGAADTFAAINYNYGFIGYAGTSTLGWMLTIENIKLRMKAED